MPKKPKPGARLELRTKIAQYTAWRKAAAKDGRSLSNWVRFVLDRAAKE